MSGEDTVHSRLTTVYFKCIIKKTLNSLDELEEVIDLRNQNDRFNHILKTLEKKLEIGEWAPGDRLPTLPILAKEFNVSVATIREVLRVLQSQDYISIEQGRGMFVNNNLMNMKNSDSSRDDSTLFSIVDLMQLIDVRSTLEPTFAEIAAKQAFAEEITSICQSAERMTKLAERQESTVEEDMHFHMLIARATHNDVWIEIYEQLHERLKAGRTHTNIPGMKEKAAHYHSMIACAIRERNHEKAKMYMASHMEGNRELALVQLNKMYPKQHIS
jgi:GntR family transcriptional regulator, transcriptional repressor for pyruvate dehydrogenase complex